LIVFNGKFHLISFHLFNKAIVLRHLKYVGADIITESANMTFSEIRENLRQNMYVCQYHECVHSVKAKGRH